VLFGADRAALARGGPPLPPPPPEQQASGRVPGHPALYALKLDDGRWLVAVRARPPRPRPNLYLMLSVIALAIGTASYPVVRRLTRRLERLETSVERWGEGQLSTRVAVEGGDEVAHLARSFNHAAGRIEALVDAQKTLLANASHELRSPLARIRMASELMGDQASPRIRAELNRNIEELDQIIGELLLASRLDAGVSQAIDPAPLDLTALAAEECARAGASLEGQVAELAGDAKLLRRLLRNLLENAQRYGGGSAVAVRLAQVDGGVRIEVCDRGPGVPENEREAIFEPFHRVAGASEAAGGVGLGLSLVRQIARHHGGEVVCLANPGGGCCFRVTLPAHQNVGLATIR
jgi:signal transduction histidine kinase